MKYKLENEKCNPTRKHDTDAGVDLRSTVKVRLAPYNEAKIPLGIKTSIPEGYFGLVVPRSGMGSKGLVLKNTVGIIDSSYTGEWIAMVKNVSQDNSIEINVGDRICQVVLIPCLLDSWEQVDSLEDTRRGAGGFGHTGNE